jgi:phenylacetic acid degradation operon negative regulatory protein
MGELRPETWMRPANLPPPGGDGGLVVVRGPLDGDDPAVLAGRLWALADLAATAAALTQRVDMMLPALTEERGEVLPPTITLAAEVVRFLRAEPLLPPVLTPQPWPPDALRERYHMFDRALGQALRAVVGR